MSNKLKIIFWLVGIVVVAVLGSVFVNLGSDWFNALTKPSQWIPNVLIPIVWTVIYALFGVVIILWLRKSNLPKSVKWLLIINGILNILWCLVFFTLQLTLVGNIVIVINLIASIVLFIVMNRYEPLYSYLIAIYPIWISLATTLNLSLWILN
jgi:tryptophan-rich sensory protein